MVGYVMYCMPEYFMCCMDIKRSLDVVFVAERMQYHPLLSTLSAMTPSLQRTLQVF